MPFTSGGKDSPARGGLTRGNHTEPAPGPREPLDLCREVTPSALWLSGHVQRNAVHLAEPGKKTHVSC